MNPSKTASTSRVKTFSKLCALLALGVLSNAGFAEDKPKAQIPAAGADGWISLFNGTRTSPAGKVSKATGPLWTARSNAPRPSRTPNRPI